MVLKGLKLAAAIDANMPVEEGNRWHLGASIIGRPCARDIFYKHRWAKAVTPPPRIRRLFDRGHREEARILKWLEDAGVAIAVVPDGEQHRVIDKSGHFGGSLDAILAGVPDLPGDICLGEFKTHNDKSFANVSARGVEEAKPEHFTQMQVYMQKKALSFGIYIAVNKNDDDLYIEIVPFNLEAAQNAQVRANFILAAEQPPERVADNPAFWMCRMCDFRGICHGTDVPDINCRTCAHVSIGPNGTWNCTKHRYVFTKALEEGGLEAVTLDGKKSKKLPVRMADGCKDHVFNPYMLNGVEFLGGNEADNYTVLRHKDGTIIENGPTRTPSDQLCLSDPSPIKPKPSTKASSTSTRKKKATG